MKIDKRRFASPERTPHEGIRLLFADEITRGIPHDGCIQLTNPEKTSR